MNSASAILFGTALAIFWPQGASAQDAEASRTCADDDAIDIETVRVQQIVAGDAGKARVHFFRNGKPDRDKLTASRDPVETKCPSAEESCQRRAYLVDGDRVLVSRTLEDFSCATYVARNGSKTSGWLPTAQLGIAEHQILAANDWAGSWKSTPNSAELTIRDLGSGRLEISGTAYFGMNDPDRAAIGAVNIGEVEPTEVAMTGATLIFASGNGNVPLEDFDELRDQGVCVLIAQRMAEALLVRDSDRCGGMNVSFNGLYTR